MQTVTVMERRYCLMWITQYVVLEFLHVLQLRSFICSLWFQNWLFSVVLELGSVVVLEIFYVVL